MRNLLRTVRTAAAAAGTARWVWCALQHRPPGGADLWNRVNHRGETITLLEGPAYAAAAAAGVVLAPGVPARLKAAGVVATLGGATFGAVDDLRETGTSKGLRGHLGELARGRVTTGGLKVLGIGATGLVSAVLLRDSCGTSGGRDASGGSGSAFGDGDQSPGTGAGRPLSGVAGVLADGALVAGTANLLNLFDLRPGRALKVVLLTAPAAAGGGPAGRLVAAAGGAAGALLPPDLDEQSMLGDTGANAAGALLGVAAVAGLNRRGRLAALAGVAALTLASERVSFTKVIARTPVLRELDALGRRPPETAEEGPSTSRT